MDKKFKQLEFELKKDIHSIIRNEQQKLNDFIKKMKLAEYNREWKKIESFHILSTKIPIRNSGKIKKPRLIKYNIRNHILEYKTFKHKIPENLYDHYKTLNFILNQKYLIRRFKCTKV